MYQKTCKSISKCSVSVLDEERARRRGRRWREEFDEDDNEEDEKGRKKRLQRNWDGWKEGESEKMERNSELSGIKEILLNFPKIANKFTW